MSALNALLTTQYHDAMQRAQVTQRRKLKNGLHIDITAHANGITLKLARDEQYPSMSEWTTVLNHFPYFTGKVEPVKIIDSDKRHALTGVVPRREQVAHQMKFE
jgi:hypothetical protein